MIQKIKDLMTIKEEITKISEKFDNLNATVKIYSDNVNTLRTEIDSLKESQSRLVENLKNDSSSFRELSEELHKEIGDFKIIKSRLETKIVEKFEQEIREELIPRFNRLEKHVKEFEELGGKVSVIGNRVVNLSSELQKFCDISENIKAGDYDLVRYKKELDSMNSEKLELMRKIDTMERLVSKMRRSR